MSASIDVMNIEGEKSGAIDLPAQLFETNPSEYAVYRAVVAYEAHQRQGTASTKTRSEVARSGRKHHRQKGTGQARRGTAATNLLRGGGVVEKYSSRERYVMHNTVSGERFYADKPYTWRCYAYRSRRWWLREPHHVFITTHVFTRSCLLYTSPSPRD